MGNALALMSSFPERDVFSEMDPPKSLLVDEKGFILCAWKEFAQQEIENFLKIFAQKWCKMIEWDYQRFFDVLYGETVLQQDIIISSKIDFSENTPLEYQKFHLKKHTDGFEFWLKENINGVVTIDDVIHFFWRNGIVWNFDIEMLKGIIANPWLKTRSIFITDEWGENKKTIEEQLFDPMFFVNQIRAKALQIIPSEVPQKTLSERLIEANNVQDDREQEDKLLKQLEEQKWILKQQLIDFIYSQEKSNMHNFVAQFVVVDYSQNDLELPLSNLESISEWLKIVQHKIEQYKWFLRKRDVLNRPWLESYFRVLLTLRQYILIHQEIVQIITKKL